MISKWKNAPFFQLRTGGSGHRFHNGKNRVAQTESNQRPPACNSTALAPRAIYDTEWGRLVNNTTLFSSVVPLRPHTPGPGLCRSVFSRPVCPYAIVTFDPVTRDVTILPGAVPASALTGGGGRPRWGGAAPNTPDGWLHVLRVSLQRMDRMGRTDQLVRYSDGRYLTFDPAEVAGCSAALYATDTRQSAQLHSLRASRLSPPTPPHYARACVLRCRVWNGLSRNDPVQSKSTSH